MVKNQSEDVQHPMSTFMPASTRIVDKRIADNKPVNSTFKVTKQQQNMNSLSSSTKSNKSALSTLSSLTTNSSSYRSNDGAIVVIEIGADDVGIDVGTIDDHMISTSPSSSPSSFSSSSSPNSSNSVKNTEKTENDSYNLTSHESIEFNSNPSSFTGSIHEERGIDCPEYFVPEIKQKPCYPPSLLQLKSNEQVSIIESVEPKRNKSKTESKKSSKSKQTNDLIDSKTSQSNLLLNNADFEAEIVEQVKEKLPDKAVIQSFDNSSMRFIDDDEKLKKNLNSSNNLNHSFDNALKDNYSEFSFVSPTNNKPKIQPKPSLSLDTFECVVNELNLSNKSSVGKKLFDKQQLKEDYDKPVNKQLENVQQNFVKRNSIRKSSKQQKLSINKNINSYDEKPIVLFNGTNEGLVNSAFSMDEICEKSAANEIRPQRPPTPPPRSDKPLSCLKTTTEESNYNLNMQTSADNNKTCFIQEIHSSRKSIEINSETAQKTSTTEINEIFNQINLIQCQLESTKPKQQQQQQENTEELTTQIQEMNLINNLYVAENSKNTLELYNKIISLSRCKSMKPELVESYSLVREIMNMIERISSINLIQNEEARSAETAEELNILLAKLDVKNLMLTHDKIAERIEDDTLKRQLVNKELMIEQELQLDTEKPVDCVDSAYQKLNNELSFNEFASSDDAPVLSEEKKYLLEKASHYGVENLRLVNIEKSERPLGATIRNVDGSVVIGRIVKGGAAEKSELVHEDDEILEINNIPVRGKTINDICEMLFNTQGLVSFLIIPNMDYVSDQLEDKVECKEEICNVQINNTLHIRALFNYVPQEDIYIPCKELGLAFNKGEILHVICQEDDDWWQALKDSENSKDELAGLIPSQCFQERRCSQIQAFIGDSFMSRKKRKNGFCMKGMAAKSRRRQMQFNNINDTLKHEIVTYEQVVLYKPPATCKRPIILIGPHSIGRHELRKRLMQQCPSVYEVAVPHTTRLPRREEIDGKDYHFLARHIFEADIKQGRFIEHGEYEKNLYGTSSESIRKVITNSKICVLNLYPQALKALRSSDLMPYVIFIGASNLSKLKELKTKLHQNYRENDLLDIIDKGREIEEQYGHFFDKIIRNSDMEKTYNELTDTIEKVQNEENWIPARWLQNLK